MESIPRGQVEAGTALGMSYMQVMIHIVLPQALRTAFPALTNSFLSMLKDTSLAANITVAEMFMSTQRIVARTYEPLPLYIELAFIYLMFCTVITKLQRYVEKKMNYDAVQDLIDNKERVTEVYKKLPCFMDEMNDKYSTKLGIKR